MALSVLKPGIQATLQAAPRLGLRHSGVPASGPADPLSMALANRLVGNPSDACTLEMPFGLLAFEATADCTVAFAGAEAGIDIDGGTARLHETLRLGVGARLRVGAPETGLRIYMAIAGGFRGEAFLGSASTCLPAGFGGFGGRALQAGDTLEIAAPANAPARQETPVAMRPAFTHSFALRCVEGPDVSAIPDWSPEQAFQATRRGDRIGVEISGPWPTPDDAAMKPSAPVFPGAVQLTPSGDAFVLLPDSQTTGGYPHVLQVIRADRHLLGQIRPGDRIRFLRRTPDEAAEDLRRKTEWFRAWLPDFRF